jgi:hypothetical protein
MVLRAAPAARKKERITFDEMGPDADSGTQRCAFVAIAVDKINK